MCIFCLANMFKIHGLFAVAYIRRVDGFLGCYRGLVPNLFASTTSISTITYQKLYERIVEEGTVPNDDDEAAEDGR